MGGALAVLYGNYTKSGSMSVNTCTLHTLHQIGSSSQFMLTIHSKQCIGSTVPQFFGSMLHM